MPIFNIPLPSAIGVVVEEIIESSQLPSLLAFTDNISLIMTQHLPCLSLPHSLAPYLLQNNPVNNICASVLKIAIEEHKKQRPIITPEEHKACVNVHSLLSKLYNPSHFPPITASVTAVSTINSTSDTQEQVKLVYKAFKRQLDSALSELPSTSHEEPSGSSSSIISSTDCETEKPSSSKKARLSTQLSTSSESLLTSEIDPTATTNMLYIVNLTPKDFDSKLSTINLLPIMG